MAATALADYTALTKKLYSSNKLFNLAARKHPFFRDVPKEGNWTGDGTYNHPTIYDNAQGISATLADAQENVSATKHVRWALTTATKYGVCSLDAKFIAFTKNDAGAFVRGMKTEIDSVAEEFGMDVARDLYSIGGGALGKRASISSNTVTLSNAADVKNFKVGMTVRAATTEAATSMRTGQTTVASKSLSGGTITLTDASQLASFGDGDYLVRDGNQALCIAGLGSPFDTTSKLGWVPNALPDTTTWFGVDRSVSDPELTGWRITDTTLPPDEAVIQMGANISILGGEMTHLYGHPNTVVAFMKRAQQKLIRDDNQEAVFGFTGVRVMTPAGSPKLIADPDCPSGRLYCLDMSTFLLKFGGPDLIHWVDEDGLTWLRSATADTFEARKRMWANLLCMAPGRNGVIILA